MFRYRAFYSKVAHETYVIELNRYRRASVETICLTMHDRARKDYAKLPHSIPATASGEFEDLALSQSIVHKNLDFQTVRIALDLMLVVMALEGRELVSNPYKLLPHQLPAIDGGSLDQRSVRLAVSGKSSTYPDTRARLLLSS